MESLNKFFSLVADQFRYGGQKYAQTETKEATDVLFDDFGKNWLLGTIAKYVKRYSNLARERDLLKIACYQYILWLKRGFHLKSEGTKKIINTTVKIKAEYFDKFKFKVTGFVLYYLERPVPSNALDIIYGTLLECANMQFSHTTEDQLYSIFALTYILWDRDIKNKGIDLDTWNEEKRK